MATKVIDIVFLNSINIVNVFQASDTPKSEEQIEKIKQEQFQKARQEFEQMKKVHESNLNGKVFQL